MKTFSKWTTEEVVKELQTTDYEQHQLNHLQNRLEERIYAWNEQELAINFIGPVLSIVDFNGDQYHSFSERELSVLYKKERLYGLVDVVVADGLFTPERPYFFLKEFKKEVDSSNDPLGQLLIAMIVAQMLNENEHPIYGAYVKGRLWHFALLDGSTYAVHAGFNALTDDLQKILGVLKNTKLIIDGLAEKHSS